MNSKWQAISSIGVILSIVLYFSSRTYFEYKEKKEFASTGLEECPKNPTELSSSIDRTIWVRSCTEYVDTYYKYNKKDK